MPSINGIELTAAELDRIRQQTGFTIPQGRWWYDKISGAWGADGGPAAGFTKPGLDMGGPLKPDASQGTGFLSRFNRTKVFVNGRELHLTEAQWLIQVLGMTAAWPGRRYSMDASGNFGLEGQPPQVNLFQVAQMQQTMAAANAAANRGGGGAYCRATAGGYIGGDGQTSYFFDPSTGSSVMS